MWLTFLSLQDEMEGLDLEGKKEQESSDLLNKFTWGLVQFILIPNMQEVKYSII